MPDDILLDASGAAALLALLLLPGLAAVRAPWTAVPFLSASFWALTWWWLPETSSRRFFLVAMLLGCAVLVLPRLLRSALDRPSGRLSVPGRAGRGWPAAVVTGAALVRVAPFALWPVAPGDGMSFHSLSALLMVWRDGMPSTYEPLLPMPGFGAHDPGFPGLAADVSLLSGLPAARAVLLVSVASCALLHLGLFALLSRGYDRSTAALAVVSALGLAGFVDGSVRWGGGPEVLASAFLCAGAALMDAGPARALACGGLLAAALVIHPLTVALATLPALLAAGAAWPRAHDQARRARLGSGALAIAAALATSAPFLWRLAAVVRAARGLPLFAEAVPPSLTLLAVATAWGLAALVGALRRARGSLAPLAVTALLAAAAAGAARGYLAASATVPVGADDLRAMAWLRTHARPGEIVCGEGPAEAWIPALTGRGVDRPELPPLLEGARHPAPKACAWTYVSEPGPSGRARQGARDGAPAFRSGGVVIFHDES